MHLFELLAETARTYPDYEAFIDADSRCTYSQMHDTCCALAANLYGQGIRQGMHIALACRNKIPFVNTVFALLRLGAVCVPLNWKLTPEEIRAQLEQVDASFLLHDKECQAGLPSTPDVHTLLINSQVISLQSSTKPHLPPGSSKPACIIYTAGTNDSPQAVVLTHANLLANSDNYCEACNFAPGQRELATTQLFHISTFSRIFTYVRSATTCYLMKQFSPDTCFDIIERENITSITQTPTMYQMLKQADEKHKRAGAKLSRAITGASAMNPAERQTLHELFPKADLYDIYGQTEASPGISVLGPQDFFSRPDSVGKSMPGVSISIVDDKGNELPTGSTGEITCTGANIMQGYFHNEAATQAVLAHGQLRTGDMGYIDEQGFLYLAGRKKDIIITGGINVFPGEIENVLHLHPGVVDCAVFGVPDKKWGEAIVAAIVLQHTTIDEVQAHCRKHLAGFKCPKEIMPLSDIPRNSAQKTLRSELIMLWKNRAFNTT